MTLGLSVRSVSRDREVWLTLLFLVLGILVPAASILWFTNSAAEHEAEATRREISEAYEGQLRLLRDRIDEAWRDRAADLAEAGSFHRVVMEALADSAIVLRDDGTLVYPRALPLQEPAAPDPQELMTARTFEVSQNWMMAAALYAQVAQTARDPSIAARALQAQIRCLIRMGEKDRAVDLIERFFARGRGFTALDVLGRRIAADEFLLAIDLLPASDRRRTAHIARLTEMLGDYGKNAMPSEQRLFLMSETRRLGIAEAPTFQAERLAARFLEADQPRSAGTGLQATNLPNVWKLPSADGRVIALLNTQTVDAFTRSVLEAAIPAGVRFAAAPPGLAAGDIGVSAGPMLPGWQLSFSLMDARAVDAESSRRRDLYLWTGYLAIAGLASMFLVLGRSFRKQLRLARLKTDMVAAVSHELKTPLASMRLLTDALLDGEQRDNATTREYLELISSENERLTRLVENFLTFSRLERRRLPFEFREARPEDIVESAVASVREQFRHSGCVVNVRAEPDLPTLRGDPDALVTALINLLDNAYKYTPVEKHVALLVYSEGRYVVFAVIDNGIGIPRKQQKRIFRSFYQANQLLSRETGGCGLGLSIVKYIVGAHGGSVMVASRPGEGSTFSIALPRMSTT